MENMFMQRFAFTVVALSVAASFMIFTPAHATSGARSGATGGDVPLTQMPLKGYPTPEEIRKIEEEKRKQQAEHGIPNPFEPSPMPQQPGSSHVKQVYKGTPDIELKRQINDPRIDDDYVQSLIRQRAK